MFSVVALMLLSQQPVMPSWEGIASYYTVASSSTLTASGETMHDGELTCAMRDGDFGTFYRVTTQDGRSVLVRLNDRGPYVEGRIIDLSEAAMKALDPDLSRGIMRVTVERVPELEIARAFAIH
jgi:rare lipoprotein A